MKNLKQLMQGFLILITVILLSLTSGFAQSSGSDADIIRKLDEYIAALNKLGSFNGSILIAKNNQVIVRKGFGMANLEYNVLNTPDTKFRIASITKQFTAMAVMMLQERGKLNVRDSVCKYLTACPESWQGMTLHNLLTHSSGIPDIVTFPDYQQFKMLPSTPEESIQKFKNKPLDFPPGEKFNYSNSGYILLGHIIEKVSGDKYEDFLRKNIFEPLKMTNTGYDHYEKVLNNRAEGYVLRRSGFVRGQYIDMSIPFAAGGLYSTIEDLFLWDRSLYTNDLVSKKSLDAIFTPEKGEYGYGWVIGRQFNRRIATHSGSIEGFKSVIARYPAEQVSIVVLSNIGNIMISSMAGDLAAMVFGEKYELPKVASLVTSPVNERAAVKVDPKIYDAYTGQYELPMFVFTVTKEGDRLIGQTNSAMKAELIPKSETVFFIKEQQDLQITFVRDEKGSVTHIDVKVGGQQFKGKKISQ